MTSINQGSPTTLRYLRAVCQSQARSATFSSSRCIVSFVAEMRCMKFLAIRAGWQHPHMWTESFAHSMDVACAKCNNVAYQLWAPVLETGEHVVHANAEVLKKRLPRYCPEHIEDFICIDVGT